MKVENVVEGEKWHDGSRWEARFPRSWTAWRDQSIQGAPYIFESRTGSRLQIGAVQNVETHGYDYLFSIAPSDLSAAQQSAFAQTASQAAIQKLAPVVPTVETFRQVTNQQLREMKDPVRLAVAANAVRRHTLGKLVGFTFDHQVSGNGESGWEGYFSCHPWSIYALFRRTDKSAKVDSGRALGILAGIQFHDAR